MNYNCEKTIQFIRDLITWMMQLLTNNTLYTELSNTVTGNAIFASIKSVAITLCVLLFLIDFFQKSLHLQWVTWENVMLFFIKLILAKVIINNTGSILSMIQVGFTSMLTGAGIDPVGFPGQIFPGGSAVSWFFDPGSDIYDKIISDTSTTMISANLFAGFYNIWVTIVGLIMRIVFIISAIMILARVFELLVYTVIAPIPLATFACEGLQDVAKGFLKSYAAVCLQAVVIVVMFIVYASLFSENEEGTRAALLNLSSLPTSGQTLLLTFIFGAGIMQSGSWAKKFCGAM